MLTNVSTIATDTYNQALNFTINSGGNILVFGLAGIGKTEMAFQAVTHNGYDPIYLNLSVLEYPDLVGLQTISVDPLSNRKYVEYAAPKFLPLYPANPKPNHRKKVIILDELDKAKNELQNPLLELLQFHTLNGAHIDVQAFILTGNLPDEGAFSRPVSHALTNRCMVYKLEHDFQTWHKWALNNNVNPLVLGYLNRYQEMLCQPPNADDPTAYCRTSPRSWSMASKDLNKVKEHSIDFQTMLVAGRVGMEAAMKFKIWLEHYRSMEPVIKKLLEEGTPPDAAESEDKLIICAISACAAVTDACAAANYGMRERILHATNNVYDWVSTLTPDIQVAAIKSTVKIEHITRFGLMDSPSFNKAIKNINKIMEI
jgi:hypothetical protein